MRGKLMLVAGFAVGYVIGARAGRPAYDAVVQRARGVVQDERVQRATARAKGAVQDAAPTLAGAAEQTASVVAQAASSAAEGVSSVGDDPEDVPADDAAKRAGAPAATDVGAA